MFLPDSDQPPSPSACALDSAFLESLTITFSQAFISFFYFFHFLKLSCFKRYRLHCIYVLILYLCFRGQRWELQVAREVHKYFLEDLSKPLCFILTLFF